MPTGVGFSMSPITKVVILGTNGMRIYALILRLAQANVTWYVAQFSSG